MAARIVLVLALVSLVISPSQTLCMEEDLSYMTRRQPIKVYIKGFTNESGQDQVSAAALQKSLENALMNRRSVAFKIADNPAASDIQVSGIIQKYQYLKNDPLNSYMGPSAIVLDAATTENFAEMKVDFVVQETKTDKVLWKSPVEDFVEDTMTPEESIPMVSDKVSRKFLWKCFGKGKR